MGVYQSATEPEIRAKRVTQWVSRMAAETMSEGLIAKTFQKQFGIPRKVKPVITYSSGGNAEYVFRWYEVETFN